MIRRSMVVLLLLAGGWFGSAQKGSAQTNFLAPLKSTWESTRTLVQGIVAQVPEDKYDYRPTPETRSFRDQFTHLIGENYRFMAMAAGEQPPVDMSSINQLKGRDEIVKALTESYDYGAKVWTGMDEAKAVEMTAGMGGRQQMRWAMILANIVDNMDHYGNLVTMVRLNGMVPGRSAGQQQQRQPPPPQR